MQQISYCFVDYNCRSTSFSTLYSLSSVFVVLGPYGPMHTICPGLHLSYWGGNKQNQQPKSFPLIPHLAHFEKSLQSYRQKNKQHLGKNTCGGKTTTTNQRGSAGSLVDLDQGKKSSANFAIYPTTLYRLNFQFSGKRKREKSNGEGRERKERNNSVSYSSLL